MSALPLPRSRHLIRNLKLTAQQAMDALEISTAEQQRYLKQFLSENKSFGSS